MVVMDMTTLDENGDQQTDEEIEFFESCAAIGARFATRPTWNNSKNWTAVTPCPLNVRFSPQGWTDPDDGPAIDVEVWRGEKKIESWEMYLDQGLGDQDVQSHGELTDWEFTQVLCAISRHFLACADERRAARKESA